MGLGSRSAEAANLSQKITLHPPRIGVVTFGMTTTPTSGVSSVASKNGDGKFETKHFDRRSEIASDVIWVSDAKDGINAQNFRAGNYFRSSLKSISEDLGVSLMGANPVEDLQVVAATIGRTRDIVAQAYPWTDYSADWSHRDMPSCIAKLLPNTGEILQELESPLRQAYQAYSVVPDRGYAEQGQGTFTLRTNRLRYAQYICSVKVPNSAWGVVQKPINLSDLLDPEKPSLSEVSIEFSTALSDKVTPALTAFGSSSGMGRSPIRKWVSQIELAWLVEHANVHVVNAYRCDAPGVGLSEAHQLPAVLTADPIYALSIAAGLVAECHWVALSSLTSVRRPGNAATARFVDLATSTAVWLRAADRAYCFEMAKVLAKKGFAVTSYGYGSVSFFGPKYDINTIIDLADQLGTCHPCLGAIHERNLIGQDVSSMEGIL